MRPIAVLAATWLLVVAASAQQTTVFLPADRDNSLYELSFGVASNALGEDLYTGSTNSGDRRRAVIRFDVAGQIPAGATIDHVALSMRTTKTRRSTNSTTSLHRLLADWGEGTSLAGDAGGTGSGATPGDATWIHTFYDTDLWTLEGGDYVSLASAATPVGGNNQTYTWGSNINLVQDVQLWLDDPAANFGWVVIGDETTTATAKRFGSRENAVVANRPVLEVRYTAATSAGACCAPGGCTVTSDASCTALGGTFQGTGTTCSPDPCVTGTGACCNADGTCDERTAAECATQGGAYRGDGSVCATADCPIDLTPFVEPLPIPAVAVPVSGSAGGAASYDLSMVEFPHVFHPDLPPTTVWGWDDGVGGPAFPGPTVEGRSGETITVRWINDLRETSSGLLRTNHYLAVDTDCIHGAENAAKTVVHLHGAHVEAEFDGYPESTFEPGADDTYVYGNDQLAGTLWYHDHALGITRLNVYMGLFGFWILRDPVEDALDLPSGPYEIPIAIVDRKFRPDGSLDYPATWMDHFFGDQLVVNGKVSPYLEVARGRYRFRILNGSGSRTLSLTLDPPTGSMDFTVIGVEGGLLEAPVPGVASLNLGSAERADVILDFSGFDPGDEIVMSNGAPAPFPNGSLDGATNVLKFVVTADLGDTDPLPPTLRPIERLDETDAVVVRDFRLARGDANACGRSPWRINDLGWEDITEYPELGTVEVWRFVNDSGISHPMHLHLVNFQVLDRDTFTLGPGDEPIPDGSPQPPLPEEDGWKDTAMVGPGEILRVIARFEDYKGRFAYHCHILEHEDHDMMRQFETVLCGDAELDPTETCDDGGTRSWDGCTDGCDREGYVSFAGQVFLGSQSVTVEVDGVLVVVNTTSGQSAASVATALAAAIASDATLQARGIVAVASNGSVQVSAGLANLSLPGGISEARTLEATRAGVWWSGVGGATVDVARGDLATLRAGSFAATCVGDDAGGNTLSEPTDPAPGQALWYLLRDVPGGSYGDGSRDAGVVACP